MEIVELKETEMLETRQKVKELKAADFILLMLFGYNRSIRRSGVKRLMRSVKETGCFLEPIKYITAATYFAFYPEREIRLESGRVINKDSEGLDKILFVLDGQHRIEADNELEIEDKNYQSTLEAEQVMLPENVTPDMWMTTVNNNKLNWNERDRAGYIISVSPQVREVMLGKEGVASYMRQQTAFIDMSSINPVDSKYIGSVLKEQDGCFHLPAF